jgi:heptosyltransferase-2
LRELLKMTPSQILVVRLSSLGDVILTTPVLAAIKNFWPGTRVTVLTKKMFGPVFDGSPHVEEVLLFEERGLRGWATEIRRRRFDVVVDLHDTFRSRIWSFVSGAPHRMRYDKRAAARRGLVWFKKESLGLNGSVVDRYGETLAPFGIALVDKSPRLYFRPEERMSDEWEQRLGPGPFLALAPGALHATKRWMPDRFAEAAHRLSGQTGYPIVLVGSSTDIPAAEAVVQKLTVPVQNLVGKTSLREMMGVLRKSALLLTNDSGAMHVGAALALPTVALFGPTVKAFGFFPTGGHTRVLEVPSLECRPCSLHGSKTCPKGHFRCMGDISVEQVVSAATALLSDASVKAHP